MFRYDEWIPRDSPRIAAYGSHSGRTVGQLFPSPYDSPYHNGDVIGCGIDRQRGIIYFTRNGKLDNVCSMICLFDGYFIHMILIW